MKTLRLWIMAAGLSIFAGCGPSHTVHDQGATTFAPILDDFTDYWHESCESIVKKPTIYKYWFATDKQADAHAKANNCRTPGPKTKCVRAQPEDPNSGDEQYFCFRTKSRA